MWGCYHQPSWIFIKHLINAYEFGIRDLLWTSCNQWYQASTNIPSIWCHNCYSIMSDVHFGHFKGLVLFWPRWDSNFFRCMTCELTCFVTQYNILLPPFLVREKKSGNTMMSDVHTRSGSFILGVFVVQSLWNVMTSNLNFTRFGWMKGADSSERLTIRLICCVSSCRWIFKAK